jgi:hypothetical protein
MNASGDGADGDMMCGRIWLGCRSGQRLCESLNPDDGIEKGQVPFLLSCLR